MTAARKGSRGSASLWVAVGLALLFVAERIVGEGTWRTVGLVLGGGLVLAAFVRRIMWRSQSSGDVRRVETLLLAGYGGILGSLVLYVLSQDDTLEAIGLSPAAVDRSSGAFGALWPAILLVSLGGILFMELAYARMPIAEAVELRRIRGASESGLTLALSLVFLASVNYVAYKRDHKVDLSYFKTTRPSESTLRMVRGLGEPLRVTLFYPDVNEVLEELRPYFDDLHRASPKIIVQVRDHALAPDLARRHQVRENGDVLILRGTGEGAQAERFNVGTDLEGARSALRTLDGKFQRAFQKLTKPARTLYITSGHAEHSPAGEPGDDQGSRLLRLTELLRANNLDPQQLGAAQGLANRVPENARAVAIFGPRRPFLEEEAQALLQYVRNGGRVLVMIDPGVDHGLDPLLHGLGLQQLPGTLCSEGHFVRKEHTAADRAIVYANSYSAHPTVTTVTRHADEAVTVFLQGSALERLTHLDSIHPTPRVAFPLRSTDDFWRDLDGDFERDANEPRQTAYMIAAVNVPRQGGGEEGRAVVIGDGDFVTDALLKRSIANVYEFADMIQWLIGEERIASSTTSEEDVPIEHTRDQDKLWFYATTFAVPLPIVLAGLWVARRRRRRSDAAGPAGGAR